MRHFGVYLLMIGLFLANGVVLANPARPVERPIIHACTEDDESYPWLLKNRLGATSFQMRQVEKMLGIRINIVALPWKRCVVEVQNGALHAVIKISYSPQRAETLGVYPMLGDKLDQNKRLHTDSYSLFRVKGAPVQWDGKVLKVEGPVGAQTGFSILEYLQKLGAQTDDGGRSADSHLHKMLLGRLAAVALQTQEGDNSIASNQQFSERLERMQPVLQEKPYFLVFSRQFYAKYPEYAQEVWNAIEVVRESEEYKKHMHQLVNVRQAPAAQPASK